MVLKCFPWTRRPKMPSQDLTTKLMGISCVRMFWSTRKTVCSPWIIHGCLSSGSWSNCVRTPTFRGLHQQCRICLQSLRCRMCFNRTREYSYATYLCIWKLRPSRSKHCILVSGLVAKKMRRDHCIRQSYRREVQVIEWWQEDLFKASSSGRD